MFATNQQPDSATETQLQDAGVPPAPPATPQRAAVEESGPLHAATYSPEDNKLRLYPACRLDAATYERVKSEGFSWAPRQAIFVAGMWTPAREELLLELCGSIEAEEMTLAERQAERAERFAGHSATRQQEGAQLQAAARKIGQRFEMGQPILVGHHSERRARKDQERMHRAMGAAVNAWETAAYWQQRARGALAHADYKARPDVRARRIKGLEADLRKAQKEMQIAQTHLSAWRKPGLTIERAQGLANYLHYSWKFTLAEFPRELPASQYEGHMGLWSAIKDGIITNPEQALQLVEEACGATLAHYGRWAQHYENRLAYERALLGDQIGVQDMAERWPLAVGGRVLIRGEWLTIMRINKVDGKAVSISTNARFVRVRGLEEIKDYQAPTEEAGQVAAKAATGGKLCNYPDAHSVPITKAEWDAIPSDYRAHKKVAASAERGAHRRKAAAGSFLPTPELPDSLARSNWRHRYHFVHITDAKRVDPPALAAAAPAVPAPERDPAALQAQDGRRQGAQERKAADPIAQGLAAAKALAESAPQSVEVVGAVDLFPTPPELAARVAELAELQPGQRVLEPSAGTGALIAPALDAGAAVQAVEQCSSLVDHLRERFARERFIDPACTGAERGRLSVFCADFLAINPMQLGQFDAVLMNPPFGQAADIRHIQHARRFLKPGGRLVAICAAGPRQAEALRGQAEHWEELPAGTFAGTNVRAVLLLIRGT